MKLIKLEKKYQGHYLTYYVATYINASGHTKDYEFVSRDPNLNIDKFGHNLPAGVGMVTFSVDKEKVLLLKEFRLATNNWVYNFPAGLIDEGETPSQAAERELKEESGLRLVKLIVELPPSYASQGTSDELMSIVICLCEGEIKPSIYENEEIEARWYTKEEVRHLIEEKALMSVRTQMFLWQWINE